MHGWRNDRQSRLNTAIKERKLQEAPTKTNHIIFSLRINTVIKGDAVIHQSNDSVDEMIDGRISDYLSLWK